MESHYGESVRMQALAKLVGCRCRSSNASSTACSHLTPKQWLTRLRIDAAMELLGSGGSIAAIGQACGFSDQSAFSRQFKVSVGTTPRDYRRIVACGEG